MKNYGKILQQQGYVGVDAFVEKYILQGTPAAAVQHLNQFLDASALFHQPKGEGYKLVLSCLQKYLDFKFIRENNAFRFDETLFDERVELGGSQYDNQYDYTIKENMVQEERSLYGTRADIYYLLNEADQNGIASRRCISYVNSNRLHLTAVLVQLIERIVDNLDKHSREKYKEYARVIRTAYMMPEYAEYDVTGLFEVLDLTKKQYYRIRNDAISLISETLFGIFAGENGLADLYILGDEIKVGY